MKSLSATTVHSDGSQITQPQHQSSNGSKTQETEQQYEAAGLEGRAGEVGGGLGHGRQGCGRYEKERESERETKENK